MICLAITRDDVGCPACSSSKDQPNTERVQNAQGVEVGQPIMRKYVEILLALYIPLVVAFNNPSNLHKLESLQRFRSSGILRRNYPQSDNQRSHNSQKRAFNSLLNVHFAVPAGYPASTSGISKSTASEYPATTMSPVPMKA